MPADIHPVALVSDRARKAPDLLRGFQHNGLYLRLLEKLERRRQPCRSGANNQSSLPVRIHRALPDSAQQRHIAIISKLPCVEKETGISLLNQACLTCSTLEEIRRTRQASAIHPHGQLAFLDSPTVKNRLERNYLCGAGFAARTSYRPEPTTICACSPSNRVEITPCAFDGNEPFTLML